MFVLPEPLRTLGERPVYSFHDVRQVGDDLRVALRPKGQSSMFTGIVQGVGTVRAIEPRGGDVTIVIDTGELHSTGVELGGSIAVSGVCLTATRLDATGFAADVSRETLSLTTLGLWMPGSRVNIEKALLAGQALGGHYVTGHIDGVAEVYSTVTTTGARCAWRSRYRPRWGTTWRARDRCASTGSVLRSTARKRNRFDVNLVPHTLEVTTLGDYRPGTQVNLEVDIIARYVERMMRPVELQRCGRPGQALRRRICHPVRLARREREHSLLSRDIIL